jgi:hypothetical protein
MTRLPVYCSYVCPKLDALLDDYDKDSDGESDTDESEFDEDESSYASETENQDETEGGDGTETMDDDGENDGDGSVVKHGRRNICTAMMDLLRAFPDGGGATRQGVIEYKNNVSSSQLKSSAASGGMVYAIQTTLPTQTFQDDDKKEHPLAEMKPCDMLNTILTQQGFSTEPVSYKQLPADFFLPVTPDRVQAYDPAVMSAVRNHDLTTLRRLYAQGYNLQCCNAFGESLIHTVARRGYADMMHFLLHEAKISLRVCCDSGRTVLHDACWNASPNFECIALIVQACPDLLLIMDNRQLTPLAYVPKDAWGDWCSFLQEHPDWLVPRQIIHKVNADLYFL